MECPYIDRDIQPNPVFNRPDEFVCDSGFVYKYFYHFDGVDQYYNCQFCTIIGRKRDVFECLNEGEWHACPHYRRAVAKTVKDNAQSD